MSSINTSGASSAQVELSEATKEEEAGAKVETKDSEPPVAESGNVTDSDSSSDDEAVAVHGDIMATKHSI